MSTFKVAGVSTLKGQVKVRFANDLTRVKNLTKSGHTNIELLELPEAMEKPAVVTYLKSTDLYSNATYKAAIDAADAKYNAVETVKVSKAKPSLAELQQRARDTAIEAALAE